MPKPKKVIFIINNFVIGGVEKLLFDIIARLDKQKFTVSVVTVFGSGPLGAHFQELNIPIYFAAGKTPFHIKQWFYKVLWLVIAPVTFARLVWWLWRFRPAVVVTSLYQSDILGMFAGWLVGIEKRVLIHHDVYPIGPVNAWLKRKLGIGLATTVVAVSQTVKDFVVTYFGMKADRVEIINNGIDLEQFKNCRKLPQSAHLVLGMLGRLEPVKSPMVFLRALQILKTKFGLTPPSYLGGEGSLRSELVNYAIQTQLLNLKMDGEVQNVPVWMNKIDILVVPSMSEGFGLVILEGLAADKLVVVSDLPAIRELITDGINGCLFPVGDVAALADILHRLMTDPTAFNQIKQGIIQWQQQCLPHYDINRVAQRYEQLLLSGLDDQDNKGAIKP